MFSLFLILNSNIILPIKILNMKRILLYSLLFLCSCTKNEYITYSEKNGLTFTTNSDSDLFTADSIVYSFVTQAVRGDVDTIWLPISLTGKPNESPLPFVIQVDPSSTASEGVHFKTTEAIFPSSETTLNYPIVLLRAEDLQEQARSIKLVLKENEYFTIGALSNSSSTYGGGQFSSVTIHVTDQVIKPSWWGFVESFYYGVYSQTKYRFMIEICGITDFSQGTLNFPQIINYRAMIHGALTDYEKEHGTPLKDENGEIVTIPAF